MRRQVSLSRPYPRPRYLGATLLLAMAGLIAPAQRAVLAEGGDQPSPVLAKAQVATPARSPSAASAEKLERRLRVEYLKVIKGLEVPTLKAEALQAIIEDTNLVLIDIREPGEQEISMLPHALTTQEFAHRFRKGIPKGKRLVVYCTIGYRSAKYAQQLALQNIVAENLEGGVLAWSHIGGLFLAKDPSGKLVSTQRVHIFDKGWNFLHPDYIAVH